MRPKELKEEGYMSEDKALQREKTKERVQRYRNRQKSVTKGSVTPESVTSGESVTYPAIVHALVDPVKREKLTRICQSLKDFNQLENVMYGISGMDMGEVAELIEVTGSKA